MTDHAAPKGDNQNDTPISDLPPIPIEPEVDADESKNDEKPESENIEQASAPVAEPRDEEEDDASDEAEDDEEEEEEEESDDDDDEDEEEEEEDEEPHLKYARLTQHLGGLYRNGDATSTFLVAGNKMVRVSCSSYRQEAS